jgi:hypothetical protein
MKSGQKREDYIKKAQESIKIKNGEAAIQALNQKLELDIKKIDGLEGKTPEEKEQLKAEVQKNFEEKIHDIELKGSGLDT